MTPLMTKFYYKRFKAYKQRRLGLSDEAWKKLKTAKLKSGKTWTNFVLDLKITSKK